MNSETDILYNREQQLTLDLYWPTQNADSKPANSVDQQADLAIETPAKKKHRLTKYQGDDSLAPRRRLVSR